MESISATEKQSMVSSFLEIAVGQSAETALQFLQAASWQLEEAIQLFYVGNDGDGFASPSFSMPPIEDVSPLPTESLGGQEKDLGDEHLVQDVGNKEVRPPLPVKREVLYGDASLYRDPRVPSAEGNSLVAFRNFGEELKRPGIWDTDQGSASTTDSSRDNLASLYRPPLALMYHGPFEKAKIEASLHDKWLLVNLQSTKEFSSHMLNRDTWANEAVAQTIKTNFIFWQVYDDTSEGKKVCTYYNLVSIPSVLVIDPVTGQKMRSWNGMIQPDSLLEELLPFMDRGPKDHHVALPHKRPRESAHTSKHKIPPVEKATKEEDEDEEVQRPLATSVEDSKKPAESTTDSVRVTKLEEEENYSSKKPIYPSLPEEPKGDRNLLCRVGIRLPNGQRLQRKFLRSDPIQLLWSFCSSQLEEGETRPFFLKQAIPGASKCFDYDSKVSFEESGLSNSMIYVTWE
ncbi:plant UBX domain-containing protein 7-like isoform X2 [Magnolia sinica]|uniref:plant UBX domain-containing protein 7-like isoform X2 n=1 Tax=Magnolia sinica TaxID=86752 RepID=UPI0026598727|nr:plant UBX domain-containing protein 7-like isoform X2 [Magnolia sinica]